MEYRYTFGKKRNGKNEKICKEKGKIIKEILD